MVDEWSEHDVRRRKAAQVDNTVPNVARAWNYLVPVDQWRPDAAADLRTTIGAGAMLPLYGALARKP